MNDLRTAAQAVVDAFADPNVKANLRGHWLYLSDCIAELRAALEEPVPHGCHCDLEEHMSPDGCVLDENMPDNCIYARRLLREGKGKTDCEYWKPIEVKR